MRDWNTDFVMILPCFLKDYRKAENVKSLRVIPTDGRGDGQTTSSDDSLLKLLTLVS